MNRWVGKSNNVRVWKHNTDSIPRKAAHSDSAVLANCWPLRIKERGEERRVTAQQKKRRREGKANIRCLSKERDHKNDSISGIKRGSDLLLLLFAVWRRRRRTLFSRARMGSGFYPAVALLLLSGKTTANSQPCGIKVQDAVKFQAGLTYIYRRNFWLIEWLRFALIYILINDQWKTTAMKKTIPETKPLTSETLVLR